VPSRLYPILDALLSDADHECRRFGGMPDDLRCWLLDLHDLAVDAPPLDEPPPPSEWITTSEAAAMFAAAGTPLSSRSVRSLAASGKLQSRRSGRQWLLGLEDVEAEVEARLVWLGNQRNLGGSRNVDDATAWQEPTDPHLEDAS